MAKQFLAQALTYRIADKTVLHDVSLSLNQGEMVALIGPNGAGKSTLLRLLTGYLSPTSGSCHLAGKPLESWSTMTRQRLRAPAFLEHADVVASTCSDAPADTARI